MKILVNKETTSRDVFYPSSVIADPFILNKELKDAHKKLKVQKIIINNRQKLLEDVKEEFNFHMSLAKKLTTTLSLNEILKGLYSELNRFMGVDIVAVLIRKEKVNHIKIISHTLLSDNTVKVVKNSMMKSFQDRSGLDLSSDCAVVDCIEEKKKLPDTSSSDSNNFPKHDRHLASTSELLTIDGEHIGSIQVFKSDLFSENQARIFSDSIHQIARSLKNSLEHMLVLKLATVDGLTGVLNRRVFDDIISREYQRAIRYNSSLSLLLLDVDFFKKVNDVYGHQTGDDVLISIAKRITKCIRNTDVLARYGGEEFAIILPETDREKAIATAERIRQEISENLFSSNNKTFRITVSIGVTCVDAATFKLDKIAISPEQLIRMADSALYAAKDGGRNRTIAYSSPNSDNGVNREEESVIMCEIRECADI